MGGGDSRAPVLRSGGRDVPTSNRRIWKSALRCRERRFLLGQRTGSHRSRGGRAGNPNLQTGVGSPRRASCATNEAHSLARFRRLNKMDAAPSRSAKESRTAIILQATGGQGTWRQVTSSGPADRENRRSHPNWDGLSGADVSRTNGWRRTAALSVAWCGGSVSRLTPVGR